MASLTGETKERDDVEKFLRDHNLENYYQNIVDEGYDTLDDLRNIELDDLLDIGLKKGHAKRLLRKINEQSTDDGPQQNPSEPVHAPPTPHHQPLLLVSTTPTPETPVDPVNSSTPGPSNFEEEDIENCKPNPKTSVDSVDFGPSQLEEQPKEEIKSTASSPKKKTTKKRKCRNRNKKKKGEKKSPKPKVICKNFKKDGTCRFGDQCRFQHTAASNSTRKEAGCF